MQNNTINNFLIIMAGGIGSRFWPYSRNNRPKQFLDFFGTGKSLLQMTVERFLPLIPEQNILVVTNAAYKALVLEQLPSLDESQVLCEPCRRNTAPCIAYATARIQAMSARQGIQEEANIVVAASDHLITDNAAFTKTIGTCLNYISDHEDIVTLGMLPTRPETGYGYIQTDTHGMSLQLNGDGIYQVLQFKEKPDLETAKRYLAEGGYLWNSGMFIFNLPTIVAAFREHLPAVWEQFEQGKGIIGTEQEAAYINKHFPLCENISVDYGIMEKAENVMVMPADFGWSDLGTWGSLYELSDKDESGNVVLHCNALFRESGNNIVTLESGKLAVIEGLEDYIVAENDRVLLVCKKEHEQQIRDFVAQADDKFK